VARMCGSISARRGGERTRPRCREPCDRLSIDSILLASVRRCPASTNESRQRAHRLAMVNVAVSSAPRPQRLVSVGPDPANNWETHFHDRTLVAKLADRGTGDRESNS